MEARRIVLLLSSLSQGYKCENAEYFPKATGMIHGIGARSSHDVCASLQIQAWFDWYVSSAWRAWSER